MMANVVGKGLPESGTNELIFEQREGYLFATVKADQLTPDSVTSYHQKIANEISRRRSERVMITYEGLLSTTRAHLCEVVYKVKFWHLKDIKYALVDLAAKHVNEYKFAILYAASRGVDIEIFNSIPAAEQWLLA